MFNLLHHKGAHLLLLVLVLCCSSLSIAQDNRDWATRTYDIARADEKAGRLGLALGGYADVWEMDDADNECADLRGLAGLGKGSVFLKMDKKKDALDAFQKVANMKDTPEEVREAARRAIRKLQGN